jgi:hypothetical protein
MYGQQHDRSIKSVLYGEINKVETLLLQFDSFVLSNVLKLYHKTGTITLTVTKEYIPIPVTISQNC